MFLNFHARNNRTHAPFNSKEFIILSSLGGHICCFSAVLYQYSPSGFHSILMNSLHLYFKPVHFTHLNHSLHSYRLSIASISHIQAAFSIYNWCRKTKKYMHINTYTFRKAIPVNQVCIHSQPLASCCCVPGLKEDAIHQVLNKYNKSFSSYLARQRSQYTNPL